MCVCVCVCVCVIFSVDISCCCFPSLQSDSGLRVSILLAGDVMFSFFVRSVWDTDSPRNARYVVSSAPISSLDWDMKTETMVFFKGGFFRDFMLFSCLKIAFMRSSFAV